MWEVLQMNRTLEGLAARRMELATETTVRFLSSLVGGSGPQSPSCRGRSSGIG